MISLDTSGAMKLVRPEAHGGTLSRWFRKRPRIPVISSVLIEVELMRATWRTAPDRAARAAEVLRAIGVVTVSPSVVARAPGPLIRVVKIGAKSRSNCSCRPSWLPVQGGGQVSWPPVVASRGRHRSDSWPTPVRISWPPNSRGRTVTP